MSYDGQLSDYGQKDGIDRICTSDVMCFKLSSSYIEQALITMMVYAGRLRLGQYEHIRLI